MQFDMHLRYARHNRHTPPPPIVTEVVSFYDLTVVISGCLQYTVNDQKYTLKEGDAILIPMGAKRARKSTKEAVDYFSFNFTTPTPPELPVYFPAANKGAMRLLLAAFDEIAEGSFTDSRRQTTPLLAAMLSLLEEQVKSKSISPLSRKILAYLRAHLSEKVTLSDISRITFFSPVYCDAVFKRDMGLSIIDYLLHERISEAKRRMLEGAQSLPQIAQSVGFLDYNYFARVFKKRTGYSPTAYRKLLFP